MFYTINNLNRAKKQEINLNNIIHIYYKIDIQREDNTAHTNIYLKFVNNEVMLIDFMTRSTEDIDLLEKEALKKLEYYKNEFNAALKGAK